MSISPLPRTSASTIGAEQDPPPQGPAGLADDDLADVPIPRIGEELVAHRGAGQRDGLGAELLGEPERLDDAVARGLGQADAGGRLDVGDDPLGAHARRQAPARAHELGGERARAHADEDALAHGPGPRDGVVAHVGLHLRVHALGGAPEGELAQGHQVALAEEVLDGRLRLLGEIDLAFLQALQQLVGREVHQLDLIGALEHGVGHRLAHDDAGDLGHDVVEALDVLDVERRVHVDARVEQLEHVLPPLGVPGARRIRVGELVDEDHRGPARERGVEVELLQAVPR